MTMNVDQKSVGMQVNLNDAEDFSCEECGNLFFKPVFTMKRLSALISPTGRETMIPIQIFACTKCDHVNDTFIRKEETDS